MGDVLWKCTNKNSFGISIALTAGGCVLDVTESSRTAPVHRHQGISKPDHSAAARGCAVGQRGASTPVPLSLV